MKARPPQKYTIEHLIEGPDGIIRPVRPEDIDIDNNKHVREAFRMIYEWQKQKGKYTGFREAKDNKGNKSGTYQKK